VAAVRLRSLRSFFIAFDFNSLKVQLRLIGVTFRAAITQKFFSYPNGGVKQRKLSDGGDKTRVIMPYHTNIIRVLEINASADLSDTVYTIRYNLRYDTKMLNVGLRSKTDEKC